MNIYVICTSGISLLTSEYSVAIGILTLYPIQIFFVCTMGSFVRHQHQRLNDFLWQFKWYKLSVCHQKIYLFFMLNAQKPLKLELLFIGDIDMELYTNVNTNILSVSEVTFNLHNILYILTGYQLDLFILHDYVENDQQVSTQKNHFF